jgi:uncharacterized membrane protein
MKVVQKNKSRFTCVGIFVLVLCVAYGNAVRVYAVSAEEDLFLHAEVDSQSGIDAGVGSVQDGAYVSPTYEYFTGKVMKVETGERDISGLRETYQDVEVRILDGAERGDTHMIRMTFDSDADAVHTGQRVVVIKSITAGEVSYYVGEPYRLRNIGIIFAFFFGLVILLGRKKGLMSIVGLMFSILILNNYIIAKILAGKDPLFVTFCGALIIVFVSLFLAHGFNKRTTVALTGTLITLGITVFLAKAFVSIASLVGTGTEEAIYLQFGPAGALNLRGLLLSGIIIGTLGVLDDVTTAQVAAVGEISEADPRLSFSELYRRGLVVGREHIASLVNTLVLAYAGASLPLFLLFNIYKEVPFWITLNSSPVAEEIIRTLVGSSALVLAVPITTALAAHAFSPKMRKEM